MNQTTLSTPPSGAAAPVRTVYVVDDDEAVRDSLQWLLEGNSYQVRSFASAEDFLSEFEPDGVGCLVLDVRMPGMSGLELQAELAARKVDLPIVFVTGHGDVPMAVAAMKSGASDFIEKPFDQAALKSVVERTLARAGDAAVEQDVRRQNVSRMARLTLRERQVLERIVAGRLNKQIADDLGISIKTVEAHRANIMEKLEAGTVADLMRVALNV
jgi:two-component system, LuxR family, response regulator TtrR